MGIDLVIAVVLVLFIFLGYRQGLLRQLANLGALAAASLLAGIAGHEAAVLISGSRTASVVLYAGCCAVAWVLLLLVFHLIFRFAARKLGSEKEGEPKPWNKKLGALFGAAEALLLAWFVVGLLDALPEDYRKQHLPRVHRELEGSLFTNWVVRPTNPATRLELQSIISDLATLSEHPDALRGIERKPEIQRIANHPKMAAILHDEGLVTDWQQGRIGRVFSDRKVREALEDAELRKMLRELPVGTILHEAAERARHADKR